LTQLHQNFSQKQGMFDITSSEINHVNQAVNLEIDVVVLTARDKHVLDRLSLPKRITFKHEAMDVEPMLLGFECLKVHKREVGQYDFHCYLEDDLLIPDP
jgi:cupin superfamily acireductone dioxygenase involved in methionine salvage